MRKSMNDESTPDIAYNTSDDDQQDTAMLTNSRRDSSASGHSGSSRLPASGNRNSWTVARSDEPGRYYTSSKIILPLFATDMNGINSYSLKAFCWLIEELENWANICGLEINIKQFQPIYMFDELRELIQRIQHHYVFNQKPMTLEEFNETMTKSVKGPVIFAKKNKFNALVDRIKDLDFDGRSPYDLASVRHVFQYLQLDELDNESDRITLKVQIMLKWTAEMSDIYGSVDVVPSDYREKHPLALASESKEGTYEDIDDLLVKLAKDANPIYYHDDFIKAGWPGFDHFRSQVEKLAFDLFETTNLEDTRVANAHHFIAIIRSWIPDPIWLTACSYDPPKNLKELVDTVCALRNHPEFSRRNLWRVFGIRENSGVGLKFYDPRNYHCLEDKKDIVNGLSAISPHFVPRLNKNEEFKTYLEQWNSERLRNQEKKKKALQAKRAASRPVKTSKPIKKAPPPAIMPPLTQEQKEEFSKRLFKRKGEPIKFYLHPDLKDREALGELICVCKYLTLLDPVLTFSNTEVRSQTTNMMRKSISIFGQLL